MRFLRVSQHAMSTAPDADRDAPRPSSRLADLVSKLDNQMRAGKGKKVPPKAKTQTVVCGRQGGVNGSQARSIAGDVAKWAPARR